MMPFTPVAILCELLTPDYSFCRLHPVLKLNFSIQNSKACIFQKYTMTWVYEDRRVIMKEGRRERKISPYMC